MRNVMATGRLKLTSMRQEHELERPEIIPASQALDAFTGKRIRRHLERKNIDRFVWAHKVAARAR